MAENVIANPHPRYDPTAWNLYKDCYLGAGHFDSKYLWSHRLEKPTDHQRRAQRARYLNKCKRAVNAWNSFLWAKPYTIGESGLNIPDELIDNVDRGGNTWDQFFQRAVKWASVYSYMLIVVDVPIAPDGLSRAEELQAGVNPYLSLFEPHAMTNWAEDGNGNLTFAVLEELGPNKPITYKNGQPVQEKRDVYRRLWTNDTWQIYKKKETAGATLWEMVQEGINRIGMIPIVPVRIFSDPDSHTQGISRLVDLAPMAQKHYNLDSLLDEILHQQTFGQLVIQGDDVNDYAGEKEGLAKLGTASVIMYPERCAAPQFISPPGSNVEALQSEMAKVEARMDELSGLDPENVGGNYGESGLAKQVGFVMTDAALTECWQLIAQSMEKVAYLVTLYLNRPEWITVTPPSGFGTETAQDRRDRVREMLTIATTPEARYMILVEFFGEEFQHLTQEEIESLARAESVAVQWGDPLSVKQPFGDM